MGEEQSLQPSIPLLPSTPKKPWAVPTMIVVPVPATSNNSSGGGDGDSALATDS